MKHIIKIPLVLLIVILVINTSFAESNVDLIQDSVNQNESVNILIGLLKEAIISNDSSRVEQSLKLVDAIVKILSTPVADNDKLNKQQSDGNQTKSSNIKEEQEENENSDEPGIEDKVFGLLGDVIKSTIGSKSEDSEEQSSEDGTESSNIPGDDPTNIEKDVYQQSEVDYGPIPQNLDIVKSSMIYPESARKSNVKGDVKVKLLIGIDGSIIKIGKVQGPKVFYNEVRSKIFQLTFTPARKNGQFVKCWTSVNFSFEKK